jgi:hypothetical protein
MRSDKFRVALEAWNFCNGAIGGPLSEKLPSPRYADCVDDLRTGANLVSEEINSLRPPQRIPGFPPIQDENVYAIAKEQYIGELCQAQFTNQTTSWYFWKSMLKNGNFNLLYGYCPAVGHKGNFRCYNFTAGCMNNPIVHHEPSKPDGNGGLKGRFYGTYDIIPHPGEPSYFEVKWTRLLDKR